MSGNSYGLERLGGFQSSTPRHARQARRSGPFKDYCRRFEERDGLPSQEPEVPKRANPNGSYKVSGKIISGSVFPGGILPANAIEIEEESPSQGK